MVLVEDKKVTSGKNSEAKSILERCLVPGSKSAPKSTPGVPFCHPARSARKVLGGVADKKNYSLEHSGGHFSACHPLPLLQMAGGDRNPRLSECIVALLEGSSVASSA